MRKREEKRRIHTLHIRFGSLMSSKKRKSVVRAQSFIMVWKKTVMVTWSQKSRAIWFKLELAVAIKLKLGWLGSARSQSQKSRIRETKNLSTDADSRTDTILERLSDLSYFFSIFFSFLFFKRLRDFSQQKKTKK